MEPGWSSYKEGVAACPGSSIDLFFRRFPGFVDLVVNHFFASAMILPFQDFLVWCECESPRNVNILSVALYDSERKT